MNPFEAMLRARDADAEYIETDALLAELRAACERYVAPCAFKVGDLVTPRNRMNVRGEGEPHIVIEVRDLPRNFHAPDPSDTGASAFGAKSDMRVLCMAGGTQITAFWVESFRFKAWAPEDRKPPRREDDSDGPDAILFNEAVDEALRGGSEDPLREAAAAFGITMEVAAELRGAA